MQLTAGPIDNRPQDFILPHELGRVPQEQESESRRGTSESAYATRTGTRQDVNLLELFPRIDLRYSRGEYRREQRSDKQW